MGQSFAKLKAGATASGQSGGYFFFAVAAVVCVTLTGAPC